MGIELKGCDRHVRENTSVALDCRHRSVLSTARIWIPDAVCVVGLSAGWPLARLFPAGSERRWCLPSARWNRACAAYPDSVARDSCLTDRVRCHHRQYREKRCEVELDFQHSTAPSSLSRRNGAVLVAAFPFERVASGLIALTRIAQKPNKSPEPTPRLGVLRLLLRRAKPSGNLRGAAHL